MRAFSTRARLAHATISFCTRDRAPVRACAREDSAAIKEHTANHSNHRLERSRRGPSATRGRTRAPPRDRRRRDDDPAKETQTQLMRSLPVSCSSYVYYKSIQWPMAKRSPSRHDNRTYGGPSTHAAGRPRERASRRTRCRSTRGRACYSSGHDRSQTRPQSRCCDGTQAHSEDCRRQQMTIG
jgi:hypothetical protein